ncbi:uncharacterized protein FPRO_08032 [Fusarium proliferatum ET1]|uniref:Uncharacterized protein n=1 Tax=Fusarium proliferatum (strain ET1) TaxID=1227346 RepID=A0A1L7VRI4_FUSPR|nr:uncharacterized protein FPRO_08032 [Fusarium proliferatum ET1]CVL11369.1 uncharacterized protein FPRN_07779 [Fusarium proliferatum]CZR43052.1 uncharacterized protein FPRO_08032 [Fusarium proliferatum ET1]
MGRGSRALAEFLNASTAGNKNCIFHPAKPSSPGIVITDTEAGLWSDDLKLHPQSLQNNEAVNEVVNNNSDDSRDTNVRRRRRARSPSAPSYSDSLSETLVTQDRRVVTSRLADGCANIHKHLTEQERNS